MKWWGVESEVVSIVRTGWSVCSRERGSERLCRLDNVDNEPTVTVGGALRPGELDRGPDGEEGEEAEGSEG